MSLVLGFAVNIASFLVIGSGAIWALSEDFVAIRNTNEQCKNPLG